MCLLTVDLLKVCTSLIRLMANDTDANTWSLRVDSQKTLRKRAKCNLCESEKDAFERKTARCAWSFAFAHEQNHQRRSLLEQSLLWWCSPTESYWWFYSERTRGMREFAMQVHLFSLADFRDCSGARVLSVHSADRYCTKCITSSQRLMHLT